MPQEEKDRMEAELPGPGMLWSCVEIEWTGTYGGCKGEKGATGTCQRFQKEMEIWQPKWEAYKKTASFKEFKCLKQARSVSEMDDSCQ